MPRRRTDVSDDRVFMPSVSEAEFRRVLVCGTDARRSRPGGTRDIRGEDVWRAGGADMPRPRKPVVPHGTGRTGCAGRTGRTRGAGVRRP